MGVWATQTEAGIEGSHVVYGSIPETSAVWIAGANCRYINRLEKWALFLYLSADFYVWSKR